MIWILAAAVAVSSVAFMLAMALVGAPEAEELTDAAGDEQTAAEHCRPLGNVRVLSGRHPLGEQLE